MEIIAPHPIDEGTYKAYLIQPSTSGTTTLNLDNTTNFATGKFIGLEEPGSQSGEIVRPTSIATNSITVSANLNYGHDTDTVAYYMDFDQVEFSKSTDYDPTTGNGTWTVLATVGIDWDNEYTYYEDTVQSQSAYYKFRYKNSFDASLNNQYSDYSNVISRTTESARTYGRMVSAVRRETRERGSKLITDVYILKLFGEALDMIYGEEDKWKCLYKTYTINLIANKTDYSLPTDFSHSRLVRYYYTGLSASLNDTYDLVPIDEMERMQMQRFNNQYADDLLRGFEIDYFQNMLRLEYPPQYLIAGVSGKLELHYFKKPTKPVSLDLVTDIDNPRIEECYAIYTIKQMQGDFQGSARYEKEFEKHLSRWKSAQYMEPYNQSFKAYSPYGPQMRRLTRAGSRRFFI